MKQLLVLHGALGSKEQMNPLCDQLRNTFEVCALSFSGHGGNKIHQPYSFDLFMHDIIQYLNQHDIDHIDIFGYSMGGYAALHAAANYPDRIGQIMTLGTKFDWTPESAAHETKLLNPQKIEEKVPAFANALNKRHQPEDWKQVLKNTADMMRSLGESPVLTNELLSGIQNRVAICLGDNDNMVSQEESQQAAGSLPNGSFSILENTPHPIEQVDPNHLSVFITNFFNDI